MVILREGMGLLRDIPVPSLNRKLGSRVISCFAKLCSDGRLKKKIKWLDITSHLQFKLDPHHLPMTQIQDVTHTKKTVQRFVFSCLRLCMQLMSRRKNTHTHVNNGVDSTLSLVWLIRSLLFQSTPIKKLSVDIVETKIIFTPQLRKMYLLNFQLVPGACFNLV